MCVGESLACRKLFLFLITILQNFNLDSLVVSKDMASPEWPVCYYMPGPHHSCLKKAGMCDCFDAIVCAAFSLGHDPLLPYQTRLLWPLLSASPFPQDPETDFILQFPLPWMKACAHNLRSWEAGHRIALSLRPAWILQQVPCQSGLRSEILSQEYNYYFCIPGISLYLTQGHLVPDQSEQLVSTQRPLPAEYHLKHSCLLPLTPKPASSLSSLIPN